MTSVQHWPHSVTHMLFEYSSGIVFIRRLCAFSHACVLFRIWVILQEGEMFCGLSASLLPWEHEFKASKKIHWLSTETSEFPQSELPRIHRRGRPRVQPGYPHPQEHHSARYWRLKRAQLQGHSASDQRGRDHQHRVVRHRYRGCRLELHRLWRHDTRNDQWERQWAFLGRSV